MILLGLQVIDSVLPRDSAPDMIVGHMIVGLAWGITALVLCFRVRSILADHLESKIRAVLPASVGLQASSSHHSFLLTFIFNIWYLQYKINQFIDESGAWTQAGTVAEDPAKAV